jgi:hypothetical protein
MSHWGPASRPAPQQSPRRDVFSTTSQSGPSGAHRHDDQQSKWSNSATSEEEARPPSGGPRTSGVHNILNPSEPQHAADHKIAADRASPQPTMAPRPVSHQYHFHGQPPAGPPTPAYSSIPPSSLPPNSSPHLERGSPTLARSFSPLGGTRRILTPKSPRAASFARASQISGESPPLPPPPPLPQYTSPRGSVTSRDMSPRSGHPQLAGLGREPTTLAPTTTPPAGPPPHMYSQQVSTGHGGPGTPYQEHMQPMPRAASFSTGPPPFTSALPGARRVSTSGPGSDGRWTSSLLGQLGSGLGGGRGIPVEGQHLLTITPTHGEEIVVPVDVHQASKQADEKRQRNAGASARFRLRKKEREKEQQMGMQKLESANRDLEKRIQELEAERDFYRGERNRLREVVLRTPAISEWADKGPPSPTSTRSGGSFATDSSSLPVPMPHSQAPTGYGAGDSSMLEPPARRRKTDPEPHFTTPSYGPSPTQPPLPPLQTASYATSASPSLGTGPSNSARLPPLRLDQPSPMSEHHPPQPHAQPRLPQQGQPSYTPSTTRAPYETGWASLPRGDSGQK